MQTAQLRQKAAGLKTIRALAMISALVLPAAALASATVSVPSDALILRPGATIGARTAANRQMTIALSLPSRDPKGAADFVTHVYTKGDKLFRQYLTPAEFAARFGARTEDYKALIAWAKANGLKPGDEFTAHTVLPLTGTAAAFEAAFGVIFHDYTDAKGAVFYAADAEPSVPAGLAGKIDGVLGLSSANHFRPLARKLPQGVHPLESGTGPGNAFSASDLRAAYIVPSEVKPGQTQSLGIFEQGGFTQADVTTYQTMNKLPAVPVIVHGVDGYGGGVNDPDIELEAVLDIDMQMAINPAAKQITVYEDGSDSFPVALVDSFSAMATDGTATSISVSYGLDEAIQGKPAIKAENKVLTQLAAQGQAVFVSSGDDGAYGHEPPTLNVSDPASQPYVTGVGGTTLFTGPMETYYAEEVWNNLGDGEGATGGGVSMMWPIPSYQLAFGSSVATANGGSAKRRNVPDVAAVGNPLTGVAVYSAINGGWITIGGTSVSAPIWAGFYSLANAASESLGFGNLGFANPTLYTLANSSGYFYPDFFDVTDGSNGNKHIYGKGGFNAGYGYDNTTGWGSFDGANMVLELALYPTRGGTTPPSAPTELTAIPATTSIGLTWKKAKGDTAYLVIGFNYQAFESIPTFLTKSEKATVTGLISGTTYEFEIFAVSAGGITAAPPIFVSTN